MLNNLIKRCLNWIWTGETEDMRWPKSWAVILCRLGYVLIRDFQDGQLTLRAMGLVYTSLLSLVPLLALGFSMLKAFGIHDVLRPTLMRFLAPLGQDAGHIVDMVVGFVDNIKVGVLGVVGLALLLYSVISLIQKVESGCNYIWQVRRARSMGRRFSEYLSVLIVGPLVVIAATSMTASVTSNTLVQQITAIEPFGTTLFLLGRLVPYFLYTVGFTFLFMFMPNTRVRLLPALAGGLFSGVLWQTASLAFATFASSSSNVNAIYSSFAILIFLLIWLYVSWLIMLVGCRVAYLLQHPEQLTRLPEPPTAGARREEELALLIMALVTHNFLHRQPPWRLDRLASYLRAVPGHVFRIVDRLVARGMLAETGEDHNNLLPRCDIDTMTVGEVLDAVRDSDPGLVIRPRDDAPHRQVKDVMQHINQAREETLAGMSIRQLAQDTVATKAA